MAEGEKCEPLAPVAAQSERLPMQKGLTVNSPLRWAWSRGNVSRSPAGSPTWEQLQPPSASSSWWLPEESARHPSISGERERFVVTECEGWMKSARLLFLSVNMCMSFLVKYTLTQGGGDTTQSAKYTSHIILVRFQPDPPSYQGMEHLCQASSAPCVWSTDAVKANVMFTKQTPRHKHGGEAMVDGLLTESNNVQLSRLSWKRALSFHKVRCAMMSLCTR